MAYKLALHVEDEYANPVQLGGGDLFPFKQESLSPDFRREQSHTVVGRGSVTHSEILFTDYEGDIIAPMRYFGMDIVWELLFGKPQRENIAADVAKWKYRLADYDVQSATAGLDRGQGVWEYTGTVIRSVTISSGARGVHISFRLRGAALDLNSSINSISTSWGLQGKVYDSGDFMAGSGKVAADESETPAYVLRNIRHSELVFRIGSYSVSSALDAGDVQRITEFDITIDLGREPSYPVENEGVAAKPQGNVPSASLSFALPKHANTDFVESYIAQDDFMADLVFIGPQIKATGYYTQLAIYLPYLRIRDDAVHVSGPGVIPERIEMVAMMPPGIPAGFPVLADREIYLETQN